LPDSRQLARTPAVEASVDDHIWPLEEVIGLLD
jgi:hypothetical protein